MPDLHLDRAKLHLINAKFVGAVAGARKCDFAQLGHRPHPRPSQCGRVAVWATTWADDTGALHVVLDGVRRHYRRQVFAYEFLGEVLGVRKKVA